MEQQLEHAGRVARNVPAGDLAEAGHANFIRHASLRELFLILANHRDFRNRKQAVRHVFARFELAAQHVARCPAALFHRRAGQCREADDIADRINVRYGSLELRADLNAAPLVRFEARVLQLQTIRVARTADAEQYRLTQQPLAAFEFDRNAPRLRLANRDNAFAQAEDHA